MGRDILSVGLTELALDAERVQFTVRAVDAAREELADLGFDVAALQAEFDTVVTEAWDILKVRMVIHDAVAGARDSATELVGEVAEWTRHLWDAVELSALERVAGARAAGKQLRALVTRGTLRFPGALRRMRLLVPELRQHVEVLGKRGKDALADGVALLQRVEAHDVVLTGKIADRARYCAERDATRERLRRQLRRVRLVWRIAQRRSSESIPDLLFVNARSATYQAERRAEKRRAAAEAEAEAAETPTTPPDAEPDAAPTSATTTTSPTSPPATVTEPSTLAVAAAPPPSSTPPPPPDA